MMKVAITGGIASGKSTVSEILRSLGYTVYDADKIYADLIKNEETVKKVSSLVGVEPVLLDGKITLDRKGVSEKVFSDKVLLKKLNEYTHKLVYEKIEEIFKGCNQKLVFFEIPLLFESGGETLFDRVIVVTRDKATRINALIKRNGFTEKQAVERIYNQIDYDNFDLTKHTVIRNDGDIAELTVKVKDVLSLFESKTNQNF